MSCLQVRYMWSSFYATVLTNNVSSRFDDGGRACIRTARLDLTERDTAYYVLDRMAVLFMSVLRERTVYIIGAYDDRRLTIDKRLA